MNRSTRQTITALFTAVLIMIPMMVMAGGDNGYEECPDLQVQTGPYNECGELPTTFDCIDGEVVEIAPDEDGYPGQYESAEDAALDEGCATETTPTVEIVGLCRIDQSGIARAVFNAAFLVGTGTWTVNGVPFGPQVGGGAAVFGVNTWQANPDQGEPIAGQFIIEDCTPVTTTDPTTTTTEATTTTTVAQTTVTTEPPATTVTTDPGTLPFTGIDRGKLIALGASGLALGLLLVAGARGREEGIEEIS